LLKIGPRFSLIPIDTASPRNSIISKRGQAREGKRENIEGEKRNEREK